MFLEKIRQYAFDGIDTWIPENKKDKVLLFDYLQRHEMPIIAHQHQAHGETFDEFKLSFLKSLKECAEPQPLLINSHTGRDWFTLDQQIQLIDIATNFSVKTGIQVVHETHRGRIGYSPQMSQILFNKRKDYHITADFSHWTCVTESMLNDFGPIVEEAITRTRHVHARIGYENGPQVPDPRAPEWQYAFESFLGWWDRIVAINKATGQPLLTFTTEFGPPPYMPIIPFTKTQTADQFQVNCFMKDFLRKRYTDPIFCG
ncbi:hypothetical protein [Mucilaginibacter litoreus]|uniref:hypothetical protein n=1 Tax=Mucilaginibacter litoreus TaxID=1048221 RepID=UPI00366F405F